MAEVSLFCLGGLPFSCTSTHATLLEQNPRTCTYIDQYPGAALDSRIDWFADFLARSKILEQCCPDSLYAYICVPLMCVAPVFSVAGNCCSTNEQRLGVHRNSFAPVVFVINARRHQRVSLVSSTVCPRPSTSSTDQAKTWTRRDSKLFCPNRHEDI